MHYLELQSCCNSFLIPQIGMTFSSFDEAWDFWVTYGGRIGFDVRKCYTNTSTLDGLVTSSRFVCSNEGCRAENKSSVSASVIELILEQAVKFAWALLLKEKIGLTRYMTCLLSTTTFSKLLILVI